MKCQFDHHQDYQLEAISAVTDVFKDQPLAKGDFQLTISGKNDTGLFASQVQTEKGIGNQLVIDDSLVFENVKAVQKRNHIIANHPPEFKGKNFTIEMETGTGKTYVYLRSAFELNKNYGFTKFVIVVPSVAIREGVAKSLEITQEHFKKIYGIDADWFVYNSAKPTAVRDFATNDNLSIMVINIDAFKEKTIKFDNNCWTR